MAEVLNSFIFLNIVLILLLLLQCAECQFVHTLASPCGNAGKNSMFYCTFCIVDISLCGIL